MISLNRAMELWAEGWCECPHSRTAAVQELNGMRRENKPRVADGNGCFQGETRVVYRGVCELAKRMGVSRPHLSFVLHGKRKAGRKLASKLARMGIRVGT